MLLLFVDQLNKSWIYEYGSYEKCCKAVEPDCDLLQGKPALKAVLALSFVERESSHVSNYHHLGPYIHVLIPHFAIV